MAIDIPTMLTNFSTSLEPLQRLMGATFWLVGLIFCIKAITTLKKFVVSRGSVGIGSAFLYLLAGGIFFYFPTALQSFLVTFYGYDSPLAYTAWVDALVARYGNYPKVIVMLIWLFGLVWFIRGWILITGPSSAEEKQHKRGVIYIVAGILAVNIAATANILSATLQRIIASTLGN